MFISKLPAKYGSYPACHLTKLEIIQAYRFLREAGFKIKPPHKDRRWQKLMCNRNGRGDSPKQYYQALRELEIQLKVARLARKPKK